MKDKLVRASQSPFLRQNLVFFIGSLIVAVLNYLYYPVLGRLLPTESFGELQVLVSLFMQATILLQVLGLVATNIVVNEKDADKANAVLSELEKFSLLISLGLFIITIIIAPSLQAGLKFDSPIPFIILGLIFLASVPPAFTGAFLRAKKDFKAASATSAAAAGAKLILSVILVYVGFQVAGAITGILLAQLIGLVYTAQRARKLGYRKIKSSRRTPEWSILRPHMKFAVFVLATSLITTTMVAIDSIAVKYYLSPTEAGLYGGISTIARIIFYLTGSVGLVLLASVKVGQTPAKNIALLLRSIALVSALGGSALLVFSLFPHFVIHTLMGPRYDAYASSLPLLSAAIMAISLATLLSQYHVALRHYFVTVPLAIGAVVTTFMFVTNHNGITAIITSLAIGSFTLLGCMVVWTAYRARGYKLAGAR